MQKKKREEKMGRLWSKNLYLENMTDDDKTKAVRELEKVIKRILDDGEFRYKDYYYLFETLENFAFNVGLES